MQYVQGILNLEYEDNDEPNDVRQTLKDVCLTWHKGVQEEIDRNVFKSMEVMFRDIFVYVEDEQDEDRKKLSKIHMGLDKVVLDPEEVFITTDHSEEWNQFFNVRKEEVNG